MEIDLEEVELLLAADEDVSQVEAILAFVCGTIGRVVGHWDNLTSSVFRLHSHLNDTLFWQNALELLFRHIMLCETGALALNASKKIMRLVLGTELEMCLA